MARDSFSLFVVFFSISCIFTSLHFTSASSLVPLDSFVNIKNSPQARFAAFYHSSGSSFPSEILPILERAARKLKKSSSVPSTFSFVRCDGSDPINRGEFEAASFSPSTVYLFTSTPVEGIVPYELPVTVRDIVEYVKHKYAKFDEDDVLDWNSEEEFFDILDSPAEDQPADLPVPIFLKFFEPDCQHCKRLKQTFQQAATFFSPFSSSSSVSLGGGVRFMDIQCSASSATTGFCTRQQVKQYPVLKLWTGEKVVEFNDKTRSIETFDAFFEQNIDGWKRRTGKEARKRKKAEKAKKKKSKTKQEEEEDEEEEEEADVGKMESQIGREIGKQEEDEDVEGGGEGQKVKKVNEKKSASDVGGDSSAQKPKEELPSTSSSRPSVPDVSKLGKYSTGTLAPPATTSSSSSAVAGSSTVESRLSAMEDRLQRVESLLAKLVNN